MVKELVFGVQCKETGKKKITHSLDKDNLGWLLSVINRNNTIGLRTLVLIKE